MTSLNWRKLSLILSLACLLVLVVLTVKLPGNPAEVNAEIPRTELLRSGDEWIVQITLSNPQKSAADYTINVCGSNNSHKEQVTVAGGKSFVFIYHVQPMAEGDGKVQFTVYKEGVTTPLDQQIYYLNSGEAENETTTTAL